MPKRISKRRTIGVRAARLPLSKRERVEGRGVIPDKVANGARGSAEQAFTEMKQYKFGADFLHSEFKNFVYAYHPAAKAKTVVATQVLGKVGN